MKNLDFGRCALGICVTVALLPACGGSQPPIGTTDARSAARPLASHSYQVIYNFQASNDAELPLWEDAPLLYSGGLLYGTAAGGNTGEGCGVSCGTAFEVSQSGEESLLYTFKGQPDSGNPFGALISFQGTIYGVAGSGGSSGNGAIFALDSSGNERVVYSFKGGSDGAFPAGPLTTFDGTLYGTTTEGGTYGFGTVFALEPSGNERVLHSFKRGADGEHPYGGVTVLDGELYGTTSSGGTYGFGTVFGASPSGKERVIYSFEYGTDGAAPTGQLTAADGKLYGTTTDGGGDGYLGTVFEVTPSGMERVLHRFLQSIVDGEFPEGTLLHQNGKFYGTTSSGGRHGLGTVFVVTTSGKEHILHNFATVPDGRYPTGGLTAINNVFYGTTAEGGTGACAYGDGCGTVFALHP
jgi:uncharacterized repeat protein (TIGR03803 family)